MPIETIPALIVGANLATLSLAFCMRLLLKQTGFVVVFAFSVLNILLALSPFLVNFSYLAHTAFTLQFFILLFLMYSCRFCSVKQAITPPWLIIFLICCYLVLTVVGLSTHLEIEVLSFVVFSLVSSYCVARLVKYSAPTKVKYCAVAMTLIMAISYIVDINSLLKIYSFEQNIIKSIILTSLPILLLLTLRIIDFDNSNQRIADLELRLNESETQKISYHSQLHEQTLEYQQLEIEMQARNFELQETLRELQEKNSELEQLNTLDALTGIKNRRFFEEKMIAELRRARREQSWFSLIMLDIDHFKNVNDTYGHQIGDQVLIDVAATVKNILLRNTDFICRYGGEEFAIILPNTPLEGAELVANSIREKIEKINFTSGNLQFNVTASLGLTSHKIAQNTKTDTIISEADKALYAAKSSGRNQVAIADTQLKLVN